MTPRRQLWIDASAGIAGDMLLGALIDAGAALEAVRSAVDAVIPDSVRLVRAPVVRAGLRATKVDVEVIVDDPPHRTWTTIREMLGRADLPNRVRTDALAVFQRLAEAEGRVHGVPPDDIHFHEVGALDSIADVVGVCAALHDLGITAVAAGPVAVGSGRIRAAHGEIPVPVPAVVQLALGRPILSGGDGELATPTGMALISALATVATVLPEMLIRATGSGAGTKDFPDRPNVTRVMIGDVPADLPVDAPVDAPVDDGTADVAMVLEANVDDLDPRLWPGVLTALMAAGADDAWLVPILMKKGRPAHTLTVLCPPDLVPGLQQLIFAETSTLGVRSHPTRKQALARSFAQVQVAGQPITVKLAHRGGILIQATPEFEDVAAAARRRGLPARVVLDQANAAAAAAGLVDGAALPHDH